MSRKTLTALRLSLHLFKLLYTDTLRALEILRFAMRAKKNLRDA